MRDESGFTMVEVMVAMFVALLVIGALAVGFTNASNSTISAQTDTALLSVADQKIENLRQLAETSGFDALALTANPSGPEPATLAQNPQSPDYLISGWTSGYPGSWTPSAATTEAYRIETNYNDTTKGTIDGGSTYAEPLLVNGTWNANAGAVAPTFSVTLPKGEVVSGHVYITEQSAPCNTTTTLLGGSCGADARRIIVAVQDATPTGRTDVPTSPQYTSTIITRSVPSNQQNLANGLEVGIGVS
jgi:type II secretory pathway pseudopilin PulG